MLLGTVVSIHLRQIFCVASLANISRTITQLITLGGTSQLAFRNLPTKKLSDLKSKSLSALRRLNHSSFPQDPRRVKGHCTSYQNMYVRNRRDIRLLDVDSKSFRYEQFVDIINICTQGHIYEENEMLPTSSLSLEHYITYKPIAKGRAAKGLRTREFASSASSASHNRASYRQRSPLPQHPPTTTFSDEEYVSSAQPQQGRTSTPPPSHKLTFCRQINLAIRALPIRPCRYVAYASGFHRPVLSADLYASRILDGNVGKLPLQIREPFQRGHVTP